MAVIKTWVIEALERFSFFKFDEPQLQLLVDTVSDHDIIGSYESGFITWGESQNMILHHASELANQFPNKGAFPKPPNTTKLTDHEEAP